MIKLVLTGFGQRVVEAARRACPFLRADYGEDSHSLSAALDHVADWALQKLPEIPQLEYSGEKRGSGRGERREERDWARN